MNGINIYNALNKKCPYQECTNYFYHCIWRQFMFTDIKEKIQGYLSKINEFNMVRCWTNICSNKKTSWQQTGRKISTHCKSQMFSLNNRGGGFLEKSQRMNQYTEFMSTIHTHHRRPLILITIIFHLFFWETEELALMFNSKSWLKHIFFLWYLKSLNWLQLWQ